jgi:hypothetical protein
MAAAPGVLVVFLDDVLASPLGLAAEQRQEGPSFQARRTLE